MKTRMLVFVFSIICIVSSSTLMAQNKLKSWYTYRGLGYVDVQYPDEIEFFLGILKYFPAVEQSPVGFDLGFYWPKRERTILGGIINARGNRYEITNQHMQINGYLYSFSAMHYLQNRIDQGLFTRGDFGASPMVMQASDEETTASDLGFGGLIGGGYSLPITNATQILFNTNYSLHSVEGESYGVFG